MAGGRGTVAAQGLEQGPADPWLHLEAGSGVGAERARGRPAGPGPAPARSRSPRRVPSAPPRTVLTSALPQTQPDGSAQASGSMFSAPSPWKRRRPARDARKAARSSSFVNFCVGRVTSGASPRRRQHLSARNPQVQKTRVGGDPGRGLARGWSRGDPSLCPAREHPAHLPQSPEAAHAQGAGAPAEAHPEGVVGREDDVVVVAGHAFGVHGEEAVRQVPGAPQAWVVPREAVWVEEEHRGAWRAGGRASLSPARNSPPARPLSDSPQAPALNTPFARSLPPRHAPPGPSSDHTPMWIKTFPPGPAPCPALPCPLTCSASQV